MSGVGAQYTLSCPADPNRLDQVESVNGTRVRGTIRLSPRMVMISIVAGVLWAEGRSPALLSGHDGSSAIDPSPGWPPSPTSGTRVSAGMCPVGPAALYWICTAVAAASAGPRWLVGLATVAQPSHLRMSRLGRSKEMVSPPDPTSGERPE